MHLIKKFLFFCGWYEPLAKDVTKWKERGNIGTLTFVIKKISRIPESKQPYMTVAIIEAFTDLKAHAALPILLKKIDSNSEAVSRAAITAIQKMGLINLRIEKVITNKLDYWDSPCFIPFKGSVLKSSFSEDTSFHNRKKGAERLHEIFEAQKKNSGYGYY
ncbi:HEAT repeat domain-containing protein [Microscilla marina]|uniref:HEAT repeat domain-containing protein n=1 Tax=Microscilla marina ATCC 23134 TaxID=313606 RepID=A1ZFS0_MICM2|nr:HEAT repeat domain-containing protein [Microscilla marina]EAY30844.1 hypothetical protein M23134_01168 [Microscilla marina ATCC 23134]